MTLISGLGEERIKGLNIRFFELFLGHFLGHIGVDAVLLRTDNRTAISVPHSDTSNIGVGRRQHSKTKCLHGLLSSLEIHEFPLRPEPPRCSDDRQVPAGEIHEADGGSLQLKEP
jgi:hypothetical protein